MWNESLICNELQRRCNTCKENELNNRNTGMRGVQLNKVSKPFFLKVVSFLIENTRFQKKKVSRENDNQ
jgi:hypothetical protein